MSKVHKKIAFFKCKRCRHDRQKCLPKDRVWPGVLCDRCQKYGYECSANRSTAKEAAMDNEGASSVPTNIPSEELDWSVDPAIESEEPDLMTITDLSANLLLQQTHDILWLKSRLCLYEPSLSNIELPRILRLISRLIRKNRTIISRDLERHDTDFDTSIDRIEAFEGNFFVFWAEELQDRVFAEIYLHTWIQDCHRRRNFYEERYGICQAIDVQYRLVEQLSSPEYHGTPDMLYTETTALVEMYKRLTNRCRSLHSLLQSPTLFTVISELSELETKLKTNYAHSGVAVIRTLFTQLSRPWQTLAIADAICEKRCWAVLTYLGTGLDINQQMESGMSILHLAVERGSQTIVEMLIEKGVDVLAINTVSGWSALHYATWGKHARILRTLLSTELSGVILVKDKNQQTALDLARKRGVDDCIQLLQESMSQQNRQSACDDLAWEGGVEYCVQPLREAMPRRNGQSDHDELPGLYDLAEYQATVGRFHSNLEGIGRKETSWKGY